MREEDGIHILLAVFIAELHSILENSTLKPKEQVDSSANRMAAAKEQEKIPSVGATVFLACMEFWSKSYNDF